MFIKINNGQPINYGDTSGLDDFENQFNQAVSEGAAGFWFEYLIDASRAYAGKQRIWISVTTTQVTLDYSPA